MMPISPYFCVFFILSKVYIDLHHVNQVETEIFVAMLQVYWWIVQVRDAYNKYNATVY